MISAKGKTRAARKAGRVQDWKPAQGVPARRMRRTTTTAMERWARRYDALNGAPESESDR